MFKDYQFFSNNLQDAARQILEAQAAGSTPPGRFQGGNGGADPDIERGHKPIFPEGQTDSSYEPEIRNVNKTYDPRVTRQPLPPGETPPPNNYNDDDDDAPSEDDPPLSQEEIDEYKKRMTNPKTGKLRYHSPEDNALPSENEINEYRKKMMDSIVKDITKRYSKPENISKNNPLYQIDRNKTKNILPMQ